MNKPAVKQSVINHVALVLDGSGSMRHLSAQVVAAADGYVKHLAQRSQEQDQETRVSLYVFSGGRDIRCLVFDRDVLRLPSIAGLYQTGGQTALIDAALLAIGELKTTSTLHGDHSFLVIVLTDGQENDSRMLGADLRAELGRLPENWTVACFVPDVLGKREAKQYGFPDENIAVWDATTARGVAEFGVKLNAVTDNYMAGRSVGVRGTKSLFSMDVGKLNARSVSGLQELSPGQFRLFTVLHDEAIASFVEHATGRAYVIGEGFYQLTKPVDVQGYKGVAILNKKKHAIYTGDGARQLLGLPDHQVRLAPDSHPDFTIFIQSASVNRKLLAGTQLLLISPRGR